MRDAHQVKRRKYLEGRHQLENESSPRWHKKRLLVITVWGIASLLVTISLISLWGGYAKGWVWTGFGEHTKIDENLQPGKTLWEWLELLIVPFVLAGGALWFNRQERKAERELEEQRAARQHSIAVDRSHEAALQTYLDCMTELLLENGLREEETDDEVSTIARARTLTLLRGLDGARTGAVVRFLHEADLINKREKVKAVIDLTGADLSGAVLHWAVLRGADLSWVDLSDADLSWADLSDANLSGATLRGVNMRGATLIRTVLSLADLTAGDLRGAVVTDEQLAKAESLKGAIMPDGSIHE